MAGIPDDMKPTRVDDKTVDFLGIKFVETPAPPRTVFAEPPEQKASVQLSGEDGNAFFIIGTCLRAGRRAGYTKQQLDAFREEATGGDYNGVLTTAMKWFDVD